MYKVITFILDVVAKYLAKYIAKEVKKQVAKYRNKKAVESVKTAETPEEFKNAAKDIADRFTFD